MYTICVYYTQQKNSISNNAKIPPRAIRSPIGTSKKEDQIIKLKSQLNYTIVQEVFYIFVKNLLVSLMPYSFEIRMLEVQAKLPIDTVNQYTH